MILLAYEVNANKKNLKINLSLKHTIQYNLEELSLLFWSFLALWEWHNRH